MAVPDDPPAGRRVTRTAEAPNRSARASVAFGIAAIVSVVVHTPYRVGGVSVTVIAVPTLGLLATAFGVGGLVSARRSGGDRATAGWGLGIGIGILVLAACAGLFALWISGLPDNGF